MILEDVMFFAFKTIVIDEWKQSHILFHPAKLDKVLWILLRRQIVTFAPK